MVYVILLYICNGVYVGHMQAAKEARYDKEAVVKFFRSVRILVLFVCFAPPHSFPFPSFWDVIQLLCQPFVSANQKKILFR